MGTYSTEAQRRSWTFGGKVSWSRGESRDLYVGDFDSRKYNFLMLLLTVREEDNIRRAEHHPFSLDSFYISYGQN